MIPGITASQLRIITPSVPSAYTAEAVTFDGTNDRMITNSLTVSDSKQLLFSVWCYLEPSQDGHTTRHFFDITAGSQSNWRVFARIQGIEATPARFELYGRTSSGGYGLAFTSNTTFNDGEWYHIVASCDLTQSSSTFKCYINDTLDSASPSQHINNSMDFTTSEYRIGARYQNSSVDNHSWKHYAGDMAELYWTTEYLDLSVESNRRKFISASGTPVDLGSDGSTPTGTQPIVYYKGSASTWNAGTNAGSGGNYTMYGSLADSSNEPVEL